MQYYRKLSLFILVVQLLILSSVETRFASDHSSISKLWNDLEQNKDHNTNDLFDDGNVLTDSIKRIVNDIDDGDIENVERRKKFAGDSTNFRGRHSLQGLWAMPGRR